MARCKGGSAERKFLPRNVRIRKKRVSSTRRPKNSPPDCFLNGLSNPLQKKTKKNKPGKISELVLWRAARGEALKSNFRPEMYEFKRNGCHQRDALKTVPRTVFLTGFRIPCSKNAKKEQVRKNIRTCSLARCKGFEPLTFWFVAKHSLQLS